MCLMSLTLIARLGSRRDLGKENIIITMAAVSCSGDKCVFTLTVRCMR